MNLRRNAWSAPCALAALLLVAATGCEQKAPPPDPAPAKAEKASAPKKPKETVRLAALAPEEPKTVIDGIPTPEDLEEEAASTLSPDNLEIELDRLEAEITGE